MNEGKHFGARKWNSSQLFANNSHIRPKIAFKIRLIVVKDQNVRFLFKMFKEMLALIFSIKIEIILNINESAIDITIS